MSATAIAIASSANAVAMAAAAEARRAECIALEKAYDGQHLSVLQKQEYASCIKELYPQTMTGGEVIAVKVLIAIGIIGFLAGGWWGTKEDGLGFGALVAFTLAFAAPLAAAVAAGMLYAVVWLFS